MDERGNPYAPGAGTQPPLLAGRDALIDLADVALNRGKAGLAARSFVAVGLRGVGKTVVLTRVQDIAERIGYQTAFIEATEDGSFLPTLAGQLRQILLRLDRMEGFKDATRHAMHALAGFIGSLKLSYHDVSLGLSLRPEEGLADSGNLSADLTDLLVAVGAAAQHRNIGVALIVDEIQYLSSDELGAIIAALHRVNQVRLPVVLVGAGLPLVLARMGHAKSYAERLFNFPQVSALPAMDAARALVSPANAAGVNFHEDAVHEVIRATEGYPYFLQEWAYVSWNIATGNAITSSDVRKAHVEATRRLDDSFFRVRLDRTTPKERSYMLAMAELGRGSHRSGEIARRFGANVTTLAPVRSALIAKGMVYSPAHGDTAFTVPMFDAFLMRELPGSGGAADS